jgi:hypothetical protein
MWPRRTSPNGTSECSSTRPPKLSGLGVAHSYDMISALAGIEEEMLQSGLGQLVVDDQAQIGDVDKGGPRRAAAQTWSSGSRGAVPRPGPAGSRASRHPERRSKRIEAIFAKYPIASA